MRYSGRDFSKKELQWLKGQMRSDKGLNRTQLSKRFCEQFDWKKANGTVKDVSCRVAFLRMEKDGLLSLPPANNGPRPARYPIQRTLFGEAKPELKLKAGDVVLTLERVTHKSSSLWNEFIDRYHYLGYIALPGAQLRYFIIADGDVVGCLGFGASAWKVAPRDQFIGWTDEQRLQNLHLVINNARFLLLPWLNCFNLGSRILSLVHGQIAEDWMEVYHYRPVLLETFVDTVRFRGTVYKASNWIYVGQTTGRGKKSKTSRGHLPKKSIWLFPLNRHFRRTLCIETKG